MKWNKKRVREEKEGRRRKECEKKKKREAEEKEGERKSEVWMSTLAALLGCVGCCVQR